MNLSWARHHLRAWLPYLPACPGYNRRLRHSGQLLHDVISYLARYCVSFTDDVWHGHSFGVRSPPGWLKVVTVTQQVAGDEGVLVVVVCCLRVLAAATVEVTSDVVPVPVPGTTSARSWSTRRG